jgi:DNA repair exonuclease SbcCD nuclease subunit
MTMTSTNTDRPLRVICISDIHLGHKRTSTEHIVGNLNLYLSNDKVLSQVDLLVFAGDVFDDLLTVPHRDSQLIWKWLHRLLRLCVKHGVIVRVLEGTPSHDRAQSELFLTVNEVLKNNLTSAAALEYVKTLSIEYIEALDIHVLYVPDEWHHDNADTLAEVRELLRVKGLEQVDYAFMHGLFGYQAPEILKSNIKHDEQAYLSLVKHLIFIGHIHLHSAHDRIYAQGSFDRLSHGEESPKGYLKAVVSSVDQYTVHFVENKGAMIYKTIVTYGTELEAEVSRVDHAVKDLQVGSHVRIETLKSLPMVGAMDMLKLRWPHLNWSVLYKDKAQSASGAMLIEEQVYVPILINPETISKLCTDRLKQQGVDQDTLSLALIKLKEII